MTVPKKKKVEAQGYTLLIATGKMTSGNNLCCGSPVAIPDHWYSQRNSALKQNINNQSWYE